MHGLGTQVALSYQTEERKMKRSLILHRLALGILFAFLTLFRCLFHSRCPASVYDTGWSISPARERPRSILRGDNDDSWTEDRTYETGMNLVRNKDAECWQNITTMSPLW
jgi:hypothetical protein